MADLLDNVSPLTRLEVEDGSNYYAHLSSIQLDVLVRNKIRSFTVVILSAYFNLLTAAGSLARLI